MQQTVFLQPGQQLVEDGQLAAVEDEVLPGGVRRAGLGTVEQVGVVAVLPQLHEQVEEAHPVGLPRRVYYVDVLHQDLGVPDVHKLICSDIKIFLRVIVY